MKKEVVKVLKKYLKEEFSSEEIEKLIEIPPNPAMGDYAFPCFVLSKKLKKNPNQIASAIAKNIAVFEFEKIEPKGPYINFFLNRDMLAKSTIDKIRKEKDKYGSGKYGKDKVSIEFSGANTHKAFHIGHIRGTALGESISRIMEFMGNKVIRTNYQGDSGMHVAKWIWCYKKYHKKKRVTKNEEWFASIYVDAMRRLAKNPKYQDEVDKINMKLALNSDPKLTALWEKTRKISLETLEQIYKELNTRFDKYYFESEMEVRGKQIVRNLLEKKIAKKSQGAVIIDLKKYNLGVWVLLRKDGTILYSAKDIALAESKFNDLNINKAVYVAGSEQRHHFYQLFKTLDIMKFRQAEKCYYVPVTLVRLPWGKMSSRTGENIIYSTFKKELVDLAKIEIEKRAKLKKDPLEKRALAIAVAALKYSMLKQEVNKTIVFDKKEALRFEGDTGPYLLYTHVRAKNILKKTKKKVKTYHLENITIDDLEKNIIQQLSFFPSIVTKAYEKLTPSLIANYAYQISKMFNEYYQLNRVIGSEKERFRLALVESFSQVLKNSLYLLGIPIIERM